MLGSNFYPRTLQESATIRTSHRRQHRLYFNPRTLQESATLPCGWDVYLLIFQSTHPTRECDASHQLVACPCQYFNPRTLQESAT